MHRDDGGFFQRFRGQKLLNRIPKGRMLLAVSGGADSIALLHCFWRLAREKKWNLIVTHIQHHLRAAESLRDQNFVKSFSKKLGVPCIVRSIHPPKGARVEESSRILRYKKLAQIAKEVHAKTILTAHNSNDQAETFFLNLLRGTGTKGLCGILPLRSLDQVTGNKNHRSILLVRSLLSFERSEILSYLHSQKIKFCKDSSNDLLQYRRNWVRHKMIPLIQKVQPKILRRISNLTTIFQDENEWWTLEIEKMRKNIVPISSKNHNKMTLDLALFLGYHTSLRKRFLHDWLPQSSYDEINRVFASLEKGKESMVGY